MLTCEICGEEVLLEENMKTHLLICHLESEMSCPFCSLSGVSYDDLNFHIASAHPDTHAGEESACGSPVCSTSGPNHRDPDHGPKCGSASSHLRSDNGVTTTEGACCGTLVLTMPASQHQGSCCNEDVVIPPPLGTAPINREGLARGTVPKSVVPSSVRTSEGSRAAQGSVTCCVDSDADTVSSEHSKVKQKRLSTPKKERKFPCPMCAIVCSDSFILQEHVELHLQEQNTAEGAAPGACASPKVSPTFSHASGGRRFECPMCSVVCADSFSLQQHVELHLDFGAATSCSESPTSDLILAQRLQKEEEQRNRKEEARREAVEFKKLQKQFGVDGGGGYRRQSERTMEMAVSKGVMTPADFHRKRAQMMENLASGVDDGRTRTQGMMEALYDYYHRESRDTAHVWLSAETDHYCSSAGDKGWGCGYRNFQMLLSSLHRIDTFTNLLPERLVPSVPQVQSMIEKAWHEGLDPRGASHFNQRLQGTRAWIGATEIYALFTSLGIRARIIDFHQPTGPGDTHLRLFEWVKQYFSQSATKGARLPARVVKTSQPPLYLQHQGHSRSIVGLEQKRNDTLCLLILDPGCCPADARKLLSRDGANAAVRHIRKFPSNIKHKQYQVVAVVGTLSPQEKQTCILNSKTLQAERIP